jgi:hypothetical protein
MPTLRDKFPIWHVTLFLGDQCDWGICGNVTARTESEAIAEARQAVLLAWPHVYDSANLGSTPAIARVIHRCG